jgi:hypothetical protein
MKNDEPRLAERFARAMARRHHEKVLERHALKGLAVTDRFARERFLERATEADWPDYFDDAVAVIEEFDRFVKERKARPA